jgi:hypothetical protein
VVHEVFRTEEFAERRCTHSADHGGLEVEEYRAWYVFSARVLVVKNVDAVELRVVVTPAAADVVFVAHNIPKHGAHLATALARVHAQNLVRRSSLEVGSTQEKRGGEERRNVTNSEWQFGTGNR